MRLPPRHSAWPSILAGLLLLQIGPGMADEARDHLNTQVPARPDYLPKDKPDNFKLPPVTEEPSSDEPVAGTTLLVRHVAFRGNAAIPGKELDQVAAPYRGRHLNEAEIETLRQALTRHYVDRGYINSGALLERGALAGDTLTFTIVEGRLSAIRLHGMERLHDDYILERLRGPDTETLNLDQLRERFALLLGDPLFASLNARLQPGASLGEAILDIEVTRARPYQLTAFANNYRPPSIGANSYGLSGWVRNGTGYGDLFEASVQTTPEDEDGRRYSLGWRLPLNQRGTQLEARFEHGRSAVIEAPMQILDIKSELDSKEVGLSQELFENLHHRLAIGITRVQRENRTRMLGQPFSFIAGEPDGTTRVSSWRFWQEYSYRSEKQVLALRSTFSRAQNNLEAVPDLLAAFGAPPDRHYGLWLGQGHYARQIMDNGTQVVLRGSLQLTPDRLLPIDRMSIGGINTVRGYRENQLICDEGMVFTAELLYPLIRNPGQGLAVALIPFHDFGHGRNRGEAARTLSSLGLATRLQWQGFTLDLAVARRLRHPDLPNGETLQDKGVHLALTYNFF